MQKSFLRTQILAKRNVVHTTEVREAILNHLRDFVRKHAGASIGLYWPIRGEIEFLFDFMQSVPGGVTLSLPCVEDGAMQYRFFSQTVSVAKDETGVMAPKDTTIIEPQYLFVPCIAMDKDGYRLGYGQGWFDRYLAAYPEVKAIGVVASEFLFEALPREVHDQKLDGILTEKNFNWMNAT